MFRRAAGSPSSEPRGRLDFKQLRRLFSYTKPYRLQLTVGILAVVIAGGLGLLFPLITGNLFNTAFAGANAAESLVQNLNSIGLLLVGVFVFQAIFNYLRVYMLAQVGEGVVADLRRAQTSQN
jgi:ATP-binding cassette, subfamily B, bacterial MsbA